MPESETQSGEGEGQEADKPPHDPPSLNTSNSLTITNDTSHHPSFIVDGVGTNTMLILNGSNKAAKPGSTGIAIPVTTPIPKLGSNTGYSTPSTAESPFASDSEWGPSPPSTRPPSRAINAYVKDHTPTTIMPSEDTICPTPVAPSVPPSRPGSVKSLKSSDGEGKFTLKDLLGSAPKLARKSSQRSSGGSSKKSDSDRSDASLLKKYGVCERVAIGKGATSVVKLAHKWDRSEEKLYAVKVTFYTFFPFFFFTWS